MTPPALRLRVDLGMYRGQASTSQARGEFLQHVTIAPSAAVAWATETLIRLDLILAM